jgi:hypothetical protein
VTLILQKQQKFVKFPEICEFRKCRFWLFAKTPFFLRFEPEKPKIGPFFLPGYYIDPYILPKNAQIRKNLKNSRDANFGSIISEKSYGPPPLQACHRGTSAEGDLGDNSQKLFRSKEFFRVVNLKLNFCLNLTKNVHFLAKKGHFWPFFVGFRTGIPEKHAFFQKPQKTAILHILKFLNFYFWKFSSQKIPPRTQLFWWFFCTFFLRVVSAHFFQSGLARAIFEKIFGTFFVKKWEKNKS